MKYKKLPIEVEAFKFYVDNMPDWFTDKIITNEVVLRKCDYKRYSIDEAYCEINTLEGVMRCNGGDYVIKGVNGELYPCKADIFKKTYEVSNDNKTIIKEIGFAINRNAEELKIVREEGSKVHKDIYLRGIIRGLEDALLILQDKEFLDDLDNK